MPVVRLSYPRGALSRERKQKLAASITEIVLDAEVDAVTPMGRAVTVVHFNEAGDDDWAIGGELRSTLDSPPTHFIVDVIVLEGLLEGERRGSVHSRITQAFQQAFADVDDPMLPLRIWVLVHEVREGSWGAAGTTVSALDVAGFINPDLAPELRAQVAARISKSPA
jgi:phenylpyruvate tautomerase PptA (4-oxalocrotonate tautomerase family)